MKKLVLMLAVLAISGMSFGAVIQFQDAAGEGVIYEDGQTATIEVYISGLAADSGNTEFLGNTFLDLDATAGAVSNQGWDVSFGTRIPGVADGSTITGAELRGVQLGDVSGFTEGVLYSFDLAVSGTEDIGVSATNLQVDNSFSGASNMLGTSDLGDYTVNVVPEPMTMALLGLGGLFVRRRRA